MTAFYPRCTPNRARAGLAAAFSLLLGACASLSEPSPPCCYDGDVTLAHMDQVYLATETGDRLSVQTAFPGYAPQTGFITRPFPFLQADISLITYESLLPVLPQYDANGDGRIQTPELTVLYLREAAIGLGHDVNYVGTNPRTDALILSPRESGGLVRYVAKNRSRMTPAAQAVFRDLVMVGQDQLLKGSEGGDTEGILLD